MTWKPDTEYIRDVYKWDGAQRDEPDEYYDRLHDSNNAEFDEWLREERRKVWAQCVDHLEAVLGPEMKRAAHADNPYLPEEEPDGVS